MSGGILGSMCQHHEDDRPWTREEQWILTGLVLLTVAAYVVSRAL